MLRALADGKRFCVWKALLERDSGRKGAEPPTHAQLLVELQQLRASQGLFVVILLRGGSWLAPCDWVEGFLPSAPYTSIHFDSPVS